MSSSNDPTPPDARPLPDFEQTPWHGMIGVRMLDDGVTPDVRAVCSPLAATERAAGGVHFDRTMPAVYFIDWFNRNAVALWNMAAHEHGMYCNLKRATERIGRGEGMRLVDQDGQRLN